MKDKKIKVAIIAGVHGNELQTVYECNQIMGVIERTKDSVKLYDKLDIKFNPFINYNGIRENSRDYVNYADINRMMTEYNGITELNSLIDWCDVIIDMHCSPRCANFMYLDIAQYRINDIVDWCEKHHILYGISRTNNNTVKNYAQSKGKIALTWEQSGMDIIDHSNAIDVINNYTTNIIPNLPELFDNYKSNGKDLSVLECVISNNEGIIYWRKNVGDSVSKGDTICTIVDYTTIINNNPLSATVKSNIDGVVIDISPRDYILRGQLLAEIQPM